MTAVPASSSASNQLMRQTMSLSLHATATSAHDAMTQSPTALPDLRQFAIRTSHMGATAAQTDAPVVPHERLRNQVKDCLGLGASGEVFSVYDGNLQREVAIKIIPASAGEDPQARAQLVAEARITASLSHPNVLPVYDLDVDAGGRAYFSMKRVEGRSLGSVIEVSTMVRRDEAISSGSRIVNLFIGVAQAMAYAHAEGVIHQDIKPDNIMLGQYGEVLVVDWGSAMRLTAGLAPNLYGTPLYMSPEQARSESVDARSDVYCIGASLLHTLLLRPPTWSDDADEFWARKRRGDIDSVTSAEARQAPAALLSIALKALRPLPHDRYADGAGMLQDLRQFQAGLAVSAHEDSLLERAVRFYRYHRRSLWALTIIAIVTISLAVVLTEQWVDQIASWGRPVLVEDFHDDSWRKRWAIQEGDFARQGSQLVTIGVQANLMIYATRLSGATAIDYDALSRDGEPLGDLSAVWCPDVQFSPDHGRVLALVEPYYLQFGSYDGSGSEICQFHEHHDRRTLTYSTMRPRPGITYHVRMEITDSAMQVMVDGKRILTYAIPFSYRSGYIGLYGHYPGKVFSQVRISTRGIPRKLDATALGDVFVEHGEIAAAEAEYARVAASSAGSALGDQALYKQGLCCYRDGQYDQAFAIWRALRASTYGDQLRIWDIDHHFLIGDHGAALAGIRDAYPTASTAARRMLTQEWWSLASSIEAHGVSSELSEWLQVHDEEFRHEFDCDVVTATALLQLGRFQEVLDRFPDLRQACASAHLALGHFDILLTEYASQYFGHDLAAYMIGRGELISERYDTWLYRRGLLMRGRIAECLTRPDDRNCTSGALAFLGRTDEALRIPNLIIFNRSQFLCNADRESEVVPAENQLKLLAQHRLEESLADPRNIDWARDMAHHALAVRAWRSGDHAQALHLLPALTAHPIIDPAMIFLHNDDLLFAAVMPSFLRSLAGEPAAFETGCRDLIERFPQLYQRQFWYAGRFLLGEIDDQAFLAQPWALFAPAEVLLFTGLRCDHRGQSPQAVAAYRAWQHLPKCVRSEFPNPAWIEFVAWRLEVLDAGAAVPPEGSTPRRP